jgi:hypothetical protein
MKFETVGLNAKDVLSLVRCEWCAREFTTVSGCSLHGRRAHNAAFFTRRVAMERAKVRRKARWTEEETYILASLDVNAETTLGDVDEYAKRLPGRSQFALQGHRRCAGYKREFASLQARKLKKMEERIESVAVTVDVAAVDVAAVDVAAVDDAAVDDAAVDVAAVDGTDDVAVAAVREPDKFPPLDGPFRKIRVPKRSNMSESLQRGSSSRLKEKRVSRKTENEVGGRAQFHVSALARAELDDPFFERVAEVAVKRRPDATPVALFLAAARSFPTQVGDDVWCESELDRLMSEFESINVKDSLDAWSERFVMNVKAGPEPEPGSRRRKKNVLFKEKEIPESRHGRRRVEYARMQRLYRLQRRRCYDTVRSDNWRLHDKPDETAATEGPTREVLRTYWTNLFEVDGGSDGRPVEKPTSVLEHLCDPISTGEIEWAVRALPAGSAAGPDQLSVAIVKQLPIRVLAKLFNLWLEARYLPRSFRDSRTILIPKKKNPKAASDYRPISVGSVVTRVLHKVLAHRLDSVVVLSQRQKGFRPVDGCAHNVVLLDYVLQTARRERRPVAVALIDCTNAFGSLKHESIIRACKRLGIPDALTDYISSCYTDSETTLLGKQVRVRRGVRQGDPLSPFLFNAVLDEVLTELRQRPQFGFQIGVERVNSTAYADDLGLLSETTQGLQWLIDEVTPLLDEVGLAINPAKCLTFRIRVLGKQKSWIPDADHTVNVAGRKIPNLAEDGKFDYLGVSFGMRGVQKWDAAGLEQGLQLLTRAPLKPQQRVFFLANHLLPSLFHQMSFCGLAKTDLHRYDQHVRVLVRQWCKLPKDVPNSFIHAAVADGGMGIPELSVKVRQLQLRRLLAVEQAKGDPILSALTGSQWFKQRVTKLRKTLSVGGVHLEQNAESRAKVRTDLYKSRDGGGLCEANAVPQMHYWVANGTSLMTGRNYIKALRVRINAMPTRVRQARQSQVGRPFAEIQCNKGCRAAETLNHISQACYATWGPRIRRHDSVVDLVARKLRAKGREVLIEKTIPTSVGLRKPDLIVCHKEKKVVHVIDVQVVSCQPHTTLEAADRRKVVKYDTKDIRTFVNQSYPGYEVVFGSVTFSWRGCLSKESLLCAKNVGLAVGTLQVCAIRILEETARMWEIFRRTTSGLVAGTL